MTRYKPAEFEDEDSSSIGSVALNSEPMGMSSTQIRYHTGTTFWRVRTPFEKCLLILCAGLSSLVFVLIVLLSSWDESQNIHVTTNPMDVKPLCLSQHCVTVSANILSSIDHSIDPCNDFYEYACGGWIKSNPVPDERGMWGTFRKLEQDNQLVIKNVLEKPTSELMSEAEKKAKLYYLSCLDTNETIEALGAKPLVDLISKIGGWSISGKFIVKKWTLQKSMHVTQNVYNMGGLFNWVVNEDDKNSTRHIIQIDQGGLTLPTTDNYLNKTAHSKVLDAYLDYMTKVGVLLGGEENKTKQHMQDIIEFETRLANITTPQENRRDEEKLYHLMTLREMQQQAPFLSWVDYFNNATQLVNKTSTNETYIVNFAPEFFVKLSGLIAEYSVSPDKRTVLNNYLVWQTVKTMTSYMSKPFREAYKGLRKALIGSEGREEQWRYCVNDANNVMGFAIGAMFVREVFHGKSKPIAEQMINEIRQAFIKNLKKLDWMNEATKKSAEEKANAITDMIGFPDFILIPEELDERYKDLAINDNEYFANNLRIFKDNLLQTLDKLDKPVNKTTWVMSPPAVNAYYTPTKNQIVFPAGILQSPFYDMENPTSLNFGGMGVVMGHELTHAFDDQGREYDLHGNLHQWWDNGTIDIFKQRTKCFVDQYEKFEIEGRRINGKQTLGENIADNGGLKAAFHAYLTTPKDASDQMPLPGLNFTHRQLFFLNFAQVWCSAGTSESLTLQLEKDPHCPPKFRVNGPLANLAEFSNEFNCSKSSKMNPKNKCEVW